MEVNNAGEDKRFFDNPLVTDGPKIQFYAGMPLTDLGQHNLGTLCVIDDKPRELTEQQRKALRTIAQERRLERAPKAPAEPAGRIRQSPGTTDGQCRRSGENRSRHHEGHERAFCAEWTGTATGRSAPTAAAGQ